MDQQQPELVLEQHQHHNITKLMFELTRSRSKSVGCGSSRIVWLEQQVFWKGIKVR